MLFVCIIVKCDDVCMCKLEWTKVQSNIYMIEIGFRKLDRRFRVIIIIIRRHTDLI